MENLMFFLITFIIVFITLLINYYIKKKKGNLFQMRELEMLRIRFKLKSKDLNHESLGLIFALVNSLIIAFTATICTMLKLNYLWQMIIGFSLLMALIYIVYGILGLFIKYQKGKK